MHTITLRKEYIGDLEHMILRVTEALKDEGFGILTRIDFHTKMKEKLGKELAPVVIIGACNPALAYEAYLRNKEVTSLIPCNVTVSDIGGGHVSIEIARPSFLMKCLGDAELEKFAHDADMRLTRVLDSLSE